MRTRLATVGAAALAVLALCASAGAESQCQYISLDASSGDGSVSGHAQLVVTRDHGGYRVRGTVTSYGGCVKLKGVEMHLGVYFGGDPMGYVCGQGRHVDVNTYTGHSDVVLTAVINYGPDFDSRIVALTGTGG